MSANVQPAATNAEVLKDRTKRLAVSTVLLIRTLQPTTEGRVIGGQLLRAVTSVAANYRAVCRARSKREFIAKLGIVIEECDESLFWLELMAELRLAGHGPLQGLMAEGDELLSIFVASRRTACHGLDRTMG
jgi:four helix bundle protein